MEEHPDAKARVRSALQAVGCGVLVTLITLGGLYTVVMWPFLRLYFVDQSPLPFDREVWLQKDTSLDHVTPRYRMALGLMERSDLRGMTADEVIALLGPRQPDDYPGFGFCYYLCPDPVFGLDNCWLVIQFDESGRVVGEEIQTD